MNLEINEYGWVLLVCVFCSGFLLSHYMDKLTKFLDKRIQKLNKQLEIEKQREIKLKNKSHE